MNCPKLKSFKDLRLFIYSDKKAQGGGNSIKKFFFSPVFRFTVLLRCNEFLVNNNFPLILQVFWRLWYKRLGVKLSFSIPMNVFDSGLGIVHYGLLVVSPDARIGANCRVHAGVNIGGSAGFKAVGDTKRYAPTIGKNCYIGPGAKLFGPISIGDNTVIGANAVVNKSFEGNVTLGGIPAKIISEKNSVGLIPKF